MPAPDDIYQKDVDFTSLALQYPDFAKRLKSNRQLDFSDPESVRQLTKALLHRDFALKIDLPEDRLCPPVPNRFNYILFIQALLNSTTPTSSLHSHSPDPTQRILGLDIGTGASCIYPLLACRQNPSWYFLATEIDEKSSKYAKRNISLNNLDSRIKLIPTDKSGQDLIPNNLRSYLSNFNNKLDIIMTNPPFYSSKTSMLESAAKKSRPPNSSCTGAEIEMITPGGEVSFVSSLISESMLPRNRSTVRWFSSMLGKLSSVGSIVERLRAENCTNFTVAEFIQGQKTRRWCIAWSWHGWRPSLIVARSAGSGVEKKWLPVATEVMLDGPSGNDVDSVLDAVDEEITALEDVDWQIEPESHAGILVSRHGDVWSRKARRMRLNVAKQGRRRKDKHENRGKAIEVASDEEMHDLDDKDDDGNDGDDDEEDDNDDDDGDSAVDTEPGLAVKISISRSTAAATVKVHIRWLQGQDPLVYESFCGWLKRKLDVRHTDG